MSDKKEKTGLVMSNENFIYLLKNLGHEYLWEAIINKASSIDQIDTSENSEEVIELLKLFIEGRHIFREIYRIQTKLGIENGTSGKSITALVFPDEK